MSSPFTVMTYNIGNGLAPASQLAAMLKDSSADIVGLQEVTASQARGIEDILNEKYPHKLLFGRGIPGKGLLSKFPIAHHEHLPFDEERPDLRVTLDINGSPLTVIVAHPTPPRFRKMRYDFTIVTRGHFDSLVDACTTEDPTILLGDFNMIERHAFYSRFVELGLIDAYRSVRSTRGFTLPQRIGSVRAIPFLRIDYIWHTKHLKATDAWVGVDAGSDHLPVIARLEWENTEK